MSRRRTGPSTIELLLKLPQQITALIKAEYANAKAEIGSAVKKLLIGAACVLVALFFLFWALAAFGASAILGLSLVLDPWLAALIIAVGLILLAAAAILVGVLLVKRANPVPEKTLGRVSDDLAVAQTISYNTQPDDRIRGAGERGTR